MAIQRFEDLDVWRYAHNLVLSVYKCSKLLPVDERFGLLLQIRRAAVSVPANIAEGFKRRSSKDKVHFYNIAESSLEELKYYVILCGDLGYWKNEQGQALADDAEHVSRMLGGLVRAICGG